MGKKAKARDKKGMRRDGGKEESPQKASRRGAIIEAERREKNEKISRKLDILEVTNKMQTTHQSVRKTVSVLIALLLIFAISPSSSAAPISDTFTYDASGNMISGSDFIFVYNDANQLVRIINESDSSIVAEYFYDANGQRVKKIEGNVTTYYIGEYAETRMNGSTVENTSYYFANNERVARKDPDGSLYSYHGDHLGSTSIVTNETGAQSEKIAYYPYGSLKERVGEGSTYLFTDQEFDDESGLYYYGARYYNPELTRFTQPDTITQDVYNPQNLNKYAYVLNNPLKYTDPTGNVYWKGAIYSGLGFVGGVAMAGAGALLSGTGAGAVLGVPMAVGGVALAGGSAATFVVCLTIDERDQERIEKMDKVMTIVETATNPVGLAALTVAAVSGGDKEDIYAAMEAGNTIWEGITMIQMGPGKKLADKALNVAQFYQMFERGELLPWQQEPNELQNPYRIGTATTTSEDFYPPTGMSGRGL